MKNSTKYIWIFVLILVAGISTQLFSTNENDAYQRVLKNIHVFGEIYKEANDKYVEEIDPEKFIKAGIQGMLNELDPYTVYLEAEGQDEIQIMTRGKYYGVGMRIMIRNGWATCAEQPFPGSPSERAGIREGDQIIEIDGESTKGLNLSETAGKLRGKEKGSEVQIKIRRVGDIEPMNFVLIRDEIVAPNIQYAGFAEPGVGLIHLTRFDRGADRQLRKAVLDLKEKGMESLILDLRNNPGGLLDVAVSIADIFLPKDELVVYTQGRHQFSRQNYKTDRKSDVGDMPLIVLVNGGSASASEIVAGSLQDLDRAVIIGEKSFGKGLVQTVLPLDRRGETQIKMTTAQYFLPSGRYIQRKDIFKKGRDSVLLNPEALEADSLTHEFRTKNGRIVMDDGGIKPDITIKSARTTRYVVELIRKSMFFNFSLSYLNEEKNIPKNLEISEDILKKFFTFVAEKDFDYVPDGYDEIEALEKIAKEENFDTLIASSLSQLKKDFEQVKDQEKLKSTDDIKLLIKRELLGKIHGNDASYEVMFESDLVLQKAVETLKNQDEYAKILSPVVTAEK